MYKLLIAVLVSCGLCACTTNLTPQTQVGGMNNQQNSTVKTINYNHKVMASLPPDIKLLYQQVIDSAKHITIGDRNTHFSKVVMERTSEKLTKAIEWIDKGEPDRAKTAMVLILEDIGLLKIYIASEEQKFGTA